jgi:hypothetical protein
MPTFQSIVLTDATTPTPVDHTLVPQSNEGGTAIVAESGTTKFGELRLEITPRFNRGNGQKLLVDIRLVRPMVVTETINGVPVSKIAWTDLFTGQFSMGYESTVQSRKDLIAMVASAMADSKPLLYDTVTKAEGIYGG